MIAREHILDAAEQLLTDGNAAFSMRELAAKAGVSFATPFNHFGSKLGIMQALSARRIGSMQSLFAAASQPELSAPRVLKAVDIAVQVMLSAPSVNRAVMGAISSPGDSAAGIHALSSALWAEATGNGAGLAPGTKAQALDALPCQLAITFRGALSFWTAGEFSDEELAIHARAAAASALLGHVQHKGRAELLAVLGRTARK